MYALHISDSTVELRERQRPEPPAGEALVRIRVAGICNTDLELMRGYMDFEGVPGHEFVGDVVECDDETLVGKRVVGEINAACGECEFCRQGLGRHCASRTVLGILNRVGAHAEYVTLPVENLHVVPDTLSDEEAVFTEPLAAACEVTEQVHIEPADRVVVIGDGKLGLLVAQVLVLTGSNVHVIGRHQNKLGIIARQGATTEVVAAGEESDVPERWADVVVEVTGNPSGLTTASRLLKPRGTLVLKSTYAGQTELNVVPFVVNEVTLVGSRCGPFPAALRLLEHGLVDVTSLIDDRFPLKQGPAAYERAAESDVLKVLLEMTG